jgi:6-phosphogluconate dehydrogenase
VTCSSSARPTASCATGSAWRADADGDGLRRPGTRGELDSFLIEITGHILAKKDEDESAAGRQDPGRRRQKGTGKWTVIDSANLAQPVTLIAEAVFARCVERP